MGNEPRIEEIGDGKMDELHTKDIDDDVVMLSKDDVKPSPCKRKLACIQSVVKNEGDVIELLSDNEEEENPKRPKQARLFSFFGDCSRYGSRLCHFYEPKNKLGTHLR